MPRRSGASTIARKPSGLAVTILGLVVLAVATVRVDPPPVLPLRLSGGDAAQCHARYHSEYDGVAVVWGDKNVVADAAACCASCEAHATAATAEGRTACNAWVFCGDAKACGSKLGHCWLKHTQDPSLPGHASHMTAPPSTEPSFSYPLPLTDPEVNLGPSGHLDRRADGYFHLGDLTLRAAAGDGALADCASVGAGAVQAAAQGAAREGGAAAGSGELWRHVRRVPLLRGAGRAGRGECPLSASGLEVERQVVAEEARAGGAVVLRLRLSNRGSKPIKVASLGLAMPFDQDFVGRTLPQVAASCSFVEPFLGLGGGYVQVTRATGRGPVLLLLPEAGTVLEAWRPYRHEDLMRLDFMYENTHELMLHTAGHAAREWRSASPWNTPSEATLPPGGEATYGLRLVLSPSLEAVEATLLAAGRPASLVLRVPTRLPAGADPTRLAPALAAEPASALEATLTHARVAPLQPAHTDAGPLVAASEAVLRYSLVPRSSPEDRRVRLSVALPAELLPPRRGSPLAMSIHLHVAPPASELVGALGEHGAAKGYLPLGTPDPWHRDGAFFGWDARRGERAGAAAGVAMAVKQLCWRRPAAHLACA
ncbi:hypothetical protein EMIHUDRAFT_199987 [Emiliania huxleyi CCMP1516]|uniref:Apple domain-containing protein n=2 Tax=Emiliania huxleyi TaxID=2903 RepID=A0A0D3KUR9_EMIH1|nr:hypothetical protein EMIHUDRAFT_199987 [Emiliania huxleyi CCMP1516]EOD39504.1 hypothetical protein EMIHUDRAFT_199987 [Emiliania huxleyi CCMP1516]|eukprot:XP_005791933.1 hypothetical protein EMIHUDRAFT_199987 [Emiliania huxleyi CCMP1516]